MKKIDSSKTKRNPYAKKLERQRRSVTIRLDAATIEYFKAMAEETGVRYQTLINLYLRECAATGRKLQLSWSSKNPSHAA